MSIFENYDQAFPSEFSDDIGMLVAQTFRDIEARTEPEEVPGVLYYLQRNPSTFVLRILPVENLRESRRSVLSAPEDYPSLRLLNSDDERSLEEKLEFHECDSLQLAKAIKGQLANKRFPLHEERILNVSDPGDNWWVKSDASGLAVYFKLCRTEAMESLIKAGPLGDCEGALRFLNKLYGYFSQLFPVRDFSSIHGQFFISCEEEGHPLFAELANVFIEGEIGNGIWEKLREMEGRATSQETLNSIRKANYFLMEIAAMRSFWNRIQKELESSSLD